MERAGFEPAEPEKVFTNVFPTGIRRICYLFAKFLCYDFRNEGKFMKFKMTPMKICAAIILAVIAFGYSLSSLDDRLTRYEKRKDLSLSFTFEGHSPSACFVSEISRPPSEPLARLFQLMFILFIISPPIIALMLFLIWKELKERNRMK
jgi:hypothetical protein